MKRIFATLFTAVVVLFGMSATASAGVLTESERSELSSQSSAALTDTRQFTSRDVNEGLSIGLCSDGSINLAGLVNEPGVYGVSLNIFGNITPMMTAKPFQEGQVVENYSYSNLPEIAHLPVTLVANKAPVGMYDDSIRAEFSQTVLLTIPVHGCHFKKVNF